MLVTAPTHDDFPVRQNGRSIKKIGGVVIGETWCSGVNLPQLPAGQPVERIEDAGIIADIHGLVRHQRGREEASASIDPIETALRQLRYRSFTRTEHPGHLTVRLELIKGRIRSRAEVNIAVDHGRRSVDYADLRRRTSRWKPPFFDQLRSRLRRQCFLLSVVSPTTHPVVVALPIGADHRRNALSPSLCCQACDDECDDSDTHTQCLELPCLELP